ncbi:MAG: hypothetical protein M9894_09010 [Planctomycetes bacterium]|nr:hypothetical protein [Planctomycetota bacterium]
MTADAEADPPLEPPPAPEPPAGPAAPLDGSPEPPPAAGPPASPPAPVEPPRPGPLGRVLAWIKARNDATQARWDAVLEIPRIKRTRFLAKVVAIHVRYACGYLMAGFLVSAPIQLGRGHEGGGAIFKSILLGLLFLIPFVALIPFTRMAWENMRLPEFKNLELGLTMWASIGCAAFLVATWVVQLATPAESVAHWLFDPHVAWVNLGLMVFAWLRIRFDAWLFREFYTLHPEDESLVLFRSRAPAAAPEAVAQAEAPPSRRVSGSS